MKLFARLGLALALLAAALPSFGALGVRGADIDYDIYMKALKEAANGGKTLLTDEQVRETLMAWQTELRTKTLEKNKKDGEVFLAENKK